MGGCGCQRHDPFCRLVGEVSGPAAADHRFAAVYGTKVDTTDLRRAGQHLMLPTEPDRQCFKNIDPSLQCRNGKAAITKRIVIEFVIFTIGFAGWKGQSKLMRLVGMARVAPTPRTIHIAAHVR
jgi:hypothetical protein